MTNPESFPADGTALVEALGVFRRFVVNPGALLVERPD